MESHNDLKNSGFSAILILVLVVILTAVIALAYFIFFKKPDTAVPGTQNTPIKQMEGAPSSSPSNVPTPSPSTPVTSPSSSASSPSPSPVSDLSVYKNDKYGFEISYAKPFKALSSKDDLYGYTNGVVLLYTGGQAYDVVVEVWDTKAAYESEYQFRLSDVTVFESKGKFVTLLDNAKTPESKKIIESFKLLP